MTLYVVILREPFAELDIAVAVDAWKVQVVLEVPPASEVDDQAVLLKVIHLSILDVLRRRPVF